MQEQVHLVEHHHLRHVIGHVAQPAGRALLVLEPLVLVGTEPGRARANDGSPVWWLGQVRFLVGRSARSSQARARDIGGWACL